MRSWNCVYIWSLPRVGRNSCLSIRWECKYFHNWSSLMRAEKNGVECMALDGHVQSVLSVTKIKKGENFFSPSNYGLLDRWEFSMLEPLL